ncbi:glycoside hydrolase family 105 protein, partial [Dickeya dadantii]|nr:glycoside hydrolase family 105 protein [Dickeya dadantii]
GILKAVRKRYVDPSYAEVAEKAIRGVINHVNKDGELTQVSFGTAMGTDLDFYRNIALTSMPYGQAMAILCLAEYLRVYL